MRTLITALSSVILVACASTSSPPARITLGAPKHKTERGSAIAGYTSIEYPVHLTNTSSRSVWVYGQLREWPFSRLYIRPNNSARWVDNTVSMCGLGADFHELPPGASIHFSEFASGYDVGQQMRVELPIYLSPNYTKKPRTIVSDTVLIR